jgi:hypothetical protein
MLEELVDGGPFHLSGLAAATRQKRTDARLVEIGDHELGPQRPPNEAREHPSLLALRRPRVAHRRKRREESLYMNVELVRDGRPGSGSCWTLFRHVVSPSLASSPAWRADRTMPRR